MLLMHLGLLFLIDFVDLSISMILLHAFTFDPNWLRSKNYQQYWNSSARDDAECNAPLIPYVFFYAVTRGGNVCLSVASFRDFRRARRLSRTNPYWRECHLLCSVG